MGPSSPILPRLLSPKGMASDSLLHLSQEHHVGSRAGQGGSASDAGCVAHAQGHGLAYVLPVDLPLPHGGTFKILLAPCGGHTAVGTLGTTCPASAPDPAADLRTQACQVCQLPAQVLSPASSPVLLSGPTWPPATSLGEPSQRRQTHSFLSCLLALAAPFIWREGPKSIPDVLSS